MCLRVQMYKAINYSDLHNCISLQNGAKDFLLEMNGESLLTKLHRNHSPVSRFPPFRFGFCQGGVVCVGHLGIFPSLVKFSPAIRIYNNLIMLSVYCRQARHRPTIGADGIARSGSLPVSASFRKWRNGRWKGDVMRNVRMAS